MIRLKINNKDYELPTSFDDITLEDYCRIFRKLTDIDKIEDDREKYISIKKNEATIISRLLGERDDFCLDLPLPLFDKLTKLCNFIYGIDNLKRKNEIVIDGKKYKVGEVNKFSTRKWIDIDITTKDSDDDLYIQLLAILLDEVQEDGKLKAYDGNYQKLMPKLAKMKCSDALPIVYYFFWRGANLRKIMKACSAMQEIMNRFAPHTTNS